MRLVLGHGDANGFHRALTPPEILVVTFTNAATEELRDRIRRRLAEGCRVFPAAGPGRTTTLQACATTSPKTPGLGMPGRWSRLPNGWTKPPFTPSTAGVSACCAGIAVDSGSLFDLELDPVEQSLLEEAACDYWRSTFYPLSPEQLSELIRLIGCDTPQALLGNVRPLLTVEAGMSEDPCDLLDQRVQAVETARREWAAGLDAAVALVHDAQADKTLNGNKYRAASLAAWTTELSAWAKDAGPLPGEPARLKFSNRGLSEGVNKGRSIPEHPVFGVFDRLDALLADLKIDAAVFRHAARDISRRVRQEKERRARMGFDDLLTRLHAALQAPGGQRLARAVREQFPVALIDEFQDTDPVQYAIFSSIYLNRPETGLVMIGDPKQAIFAFRGADIHTYLKARQDTTVDRRYTLGRNYRSTKGLVQSVNRLFSVAVAHPRGAFLFDDRIPFEPVDARGRSECFTVDGAAPESLYLWQLQQDGPIPKTGDEGYLHRMAESFAGRKSYGY